jgi:hypothetical protein
MGDRTVRTKAITHHHHNFLKAAYKYDNIIDLVNHERFLRTGERYIKFEPPKRFIVMIMQDIPRRVRIFDNIISAIFCARNI